jgi:carbon storage regulator
MLVLSRKSGEAICIGSGIKVSVLGIQGGRVRLGLSAPAEVPIHRAEIRRQIHGASTERPTDDSSGDAEAA